MGVLNTLGDAGIYIALERGYFADEGLQVELVPFRSGQEQIPALATNQIQFGSGSLDVQIPANANQAPPGHYMLFLLNGNGVPSVAKIIQVQ